LHLIYGPNEAGKSSALRAMTDLRFGIPLRSPDDFVHAAGDLRIAGVFVDQAGQRVGLIRRKGRGATLARLDVDTEQPDPIITVESTHERELTGGLERIEFEAMFGLNHARLREGGKLLLAGEGDLGSALFEASAGTRGIATLLATLDADAKQLYNPHGRAQNATINEARRELDEQRQALRQALTKPADWQVLNRAHTAAKVALDDVSQAVDTLRRRENELTELRTVEPLLREHDRALAELQTLIEVPDLHENAREERLVAEQTLRRAQQDLQDAELELARCAESLDGLVIEPLLLEHAEAIERLAAGIEAAARSRIEAQQHQSVITQLDSDLIVAAARVAPGQTVGEILNAVPSSADRVALEGHLLQMSRLGERLDLNRQRAEDLDQALKLGAEEAPDLPDPVARQSLVAALRRAQALGDVARQTADLDRQIHELVGQLAQALSDLGTESVQALSSAQPLLDAQIILARQELADVNEVLHGAHEEDLRLERDLDEQRLRQRQLAAEGEIITAETLRLARERRDEAWALIRRTYVEHSDEVEELGRAFAPSNSLPEAFEAAQSEADRQADMLRADAKRAAWFEECVARIEQMDRRRREIAGELTVLTDRNVNLREVWAQRLAQAALPSLEAEALSEWQARRHDALQLAERVAALRTDRDRVLAEATTTASSIVVTLQAVGQLAEGAGVAGESSALPSLIEQAVWWDKLASEAEAEHGARAKAARAQRAERDKVGALITETETELQRHKTALQTWHARLFLPAGSLSEAVKARLDEFGTLVRQSTALNDLRQRQAHHQAVVDDLTAQAAQLAVLLNESTPVSADDFADRMRKRLATSRERDQLRNTLVRDRMRAQEKKRQAEGQLATQTITLTRLCSAARVDTVDLLSERENSAARKQLAQKELSTLGKQLAQASARSKDALRQSLAGQDAVAMESERERCKVEIAQREQEQTSARQAEEQARRALESIDASDRAATAREAMESAAARYRSVVRPWARLKLAHALLNEALNRFRERAQAPMVAAASTYFSLMTGGDYERLVVDEAEDTPVLYAEQTGGKRKGVAGLSDGTADQLYLALRLAALELRRASHPQMPLVLDDVLITSDDDRVANILRALVRFAEGGQVMIFTHHGHLLNVARKALGNQAFVTHTL
jgi:uncharacterized protein YhaN